MNRRRMMIGAAALGALAAVAMPEAGRADSREVIDSRVRVALHEMYRTVPGSRELAERAHAILIMPHVIEGGFILGGSYGEGALLINGGNGYGGTPEAYYSVASASIGLQAGIQKSSHALLFMTESAARNFQRADGWQAGVDAKVAFPGNGLTAQTSTTLMNRPIIGIVFGQDGLLLGVSLDGAKYSRIVR